jgi:hypothetical protein
MSRRNIIVLSIVFIAIISIFVIKGFTNKSTNNQDDFGNSIEKYNKVSTSKEPSIIVFSYDAECCPTTEAFFYEYNIKVSTLIEDYGSKFECVYIDTGSTKTEKKQKKLLEIIDENKINQLPALIIKDSKGNTLKTIEGDFDNSEVRKFLDEEVH